MSDSVSDYLISDFFVNNNNNKDNDICKLLFELLNGTRKHHKLNSGSPYLQLGHVHIVNHHISAVFIEILPIGRSGP